MEPKPAKIATSESSNDALERMLSKINDGYQGGRVSKVELVSWIVLHFEKSSFPDRIDDIRADHFDEMAYLESLLEQMKAASRTGQKELNVAALLEPITSRKSLTEAPMGATLPKKGGAQ